MKYRIISIGEILFDIFPDYSTMGGAPFNFAFHLHQCGHTVAFLSRIGNDPPGEKILEFMNRHHMQAGFISVDPSHKTGEVSVRLNPEGVPDFIIKENMAYDFIQPHEHILRFMESGLDLFYFGTLAQRNHVSRSTLFELLNKLQEGVIIFYDINLRQKFYSREIIEESLSVCTVLKANDDELTCLKEMFSLQGDEYAAVQKLIRMFDLSSVCITKGGKGASLYQPDHQYHIRKKENTDTCIIDTVGAGDGFAAGLAIGLLSHATPGEILVNADRFAGVLCCINGALPSDSSFYKPYFP
ncbi:MAG: carbohydrate kinase [Spirochaetales bacterium]|nr:carbohydrate kinase [Spirochaetales bacterium]